MSSFRQAGLDNPAGALPPLRASVRLVKWCVGAWIVAGVLPAWISFRFLYGDGAVYLLHIVEKGAFFFPTDVRQSAQVLTQWPAVLLTLLGVADLRAVGWAFGIGLLLMPILLHVVSLAVLLRRGWTVQATVYLAMLWLLTFFGGLMATSESHVAVAVFLLVMVVALKTTGYTITDWAVMMGGGLVSFRLYEFWFFYAAGLMGVLLIRLMPRFAALRKTERAAGLTLLLLLMGSMVSHAVTLLGSSENEDCVSLLQMLVGTTYPLYVATISAWFIGFCGHVWLLSHGRENILGGIVPSAGTRMIALLLSLVALVAVVLSNLQHNTLIRYSYPFRTLNLVLPMVLLVWMTACTFPKEQVVGLAGNWSLVVLLTISVVTQEFRLTAGWLRYQEWVGTVSMRDDGDPYVPLSPTTALAQAWTYPWTQSAQSFLAQALHAGLVRGVSFDPHAGQDPYGPGHEEALRGIADAYGITWEPGHRPAGRNSSQAR